MGPMDQVSIQPQQYQRMLDFYPRSEGSSVHPTTTISEDVGFLSKVRWIKCPSNHNNIRGCWISIQGPMDQVSIQPQQYQRMLDFYPRSDGSSVHPTTTISKHVGSLIQIIVVCPCKHTNFMTSPTYGGDCFLVGFPDQFPVNISESTERMLAGEWSGRLAGKYSPLQIKTYEITQQ